MPFLKANVNKEGKLSFICKYMDLTTDLKCIAGKKVSIECVSTRYAETKCGHWVSAVRVRLLRKVCL